MITAIDTDILLDVLLPDPKYKDSSYTMLMKYMPVDSLTISEIVYSELASQFKEKNVLEGFLYDTNIKLVSSSSDALWIAARAWEKYTQTRKKSLQCSKCGRYEAFNCDECGSIITYRQHIISDFIIAGHAIAHSDRLLTRDRGFYKTYFSELRIDSGI